MVWLAFSCGIVIGGALGVFALALLVVGRMGDRNDIR
jgi:hypothetical protein